MMKPIFGLVLIAGLLFASGAVASAQAPLAAGGFFLLAKVDGTKGLEIACVAALLAVAVGQLRVSGSQGRKSR